MNDKAPRLRIIDGGLARSSSTQSKAGEVLYGNPDADRPAISSSGMADGQKSRWMFGAALAAVITSSLAICFVAAVWLLHGGGPLLAWHPTNVYYPAASSPARAEVPRLVASLPPSRPPVAPSPRQSALHAVTPTASKDSGTLLVFVPIPSPIPPARAAVKAEHTSGTELAHAAATPRNVHTVIKVVSHTEKLSADAGDGSDTQLAVWRKGEPIVVAVAGGKGNPSDPDNLQVVVRFSTISALFRALPDAEQRAILDELSKKVLAVYTAKQGAADSTTAPPPATPPAAPTTAPPPAGKNTASAPGAAGDPPQPGKALGPKPEHLLTYIDRDWELPDSL